MKLTLAIAAEYVRTTRAPKVFFSFIEQIKRIVTFTQERANRLVRYVRITRDYRSGVMVRDIEARYGCSRNTVLRYARMAELPKRPKTDDPERRAKIIKMSKAMPRPSQQDIARACHCSIALVSLVEHEAGLNRYRRSAQKQQERAP